MKCHFCEEPATVHLTQIVGGKVQKVHLCENCAKEKGVSDPSVFSLADLLLGDSRDETQLLSKNEPTCPQCGFTQSDFKKTGRLGCPHCYEVFSEIVDSMLRDMHKGVLHKGKMPAKFLRHQFYQRRLEDLQESLRKAVTEERYEEAALLRDEISQLETQLNG
ncbi:Protein-arginine kinase activator protein [Methylacidimicrobium tartarophylax]|uniref:Protein-arginine kinase activator protein n=1 Tax=Methylacidimicrobium tartarophylax TaxID=1041768 RepID=A0A5E6MBC4_9BACT|nr:UvrB/UvrC motif-containing protein [Methylacidimicrobium tartarophylax]VVM05055.1 Protein-arginine kinase activator protein [Methylacidimicrobium tartarophylax]